MTDPKREISDAALADQLFAAARDDGVSVHPAVGVRMRAQLEQAIDKRSAKRAKRATPRIALAVAAVALAIVGIGLVVRAPAPIADPPLPQVVAIAPPRPPPAQLETLVRARDSEVPVELARGAQATVQRGAALIPGIVPEVLEGEVEFRVADLPADAPFRVRAASMRLAATDAAFRVRRFGEGVEVEVEEGSVHVQYGERDEVVRAGEEWSSVPRSSRATEILEDSYRQARLMKSRSSEISAPVQVDLQTQRHQRSLLELAAAHLRAGELDRARAIYRDLEAGDPSGAALGIYLLARLEARHAADPGAALIALDRFLARFPNHALAAEARASRIEALLDLSRCDEAQRALAVFEERHTNASDLIARSRSRLESECRPSDERSPDRDH